MWQFELVPSVGSDGKPSGSNFPMSRLEATFTFAEDVSTTLSLPWSLFEHMVGNWLLTAANPLEPIRLEVLARLTIDNPSMALWNEMQLPTVTAGRLESVLQSGRKYFDAVGSESWVGSGDPAARVLLGV